MTPGKGQRQLKSLCLTPKEATGSLLSGQHVALQQFNSNLFQSLKSAADKTSHFPYLESGNGTWIWHASDTWLANAVGPNFFTLKCGCYAGSGQGTDAIS